MFENFIVFTEVIKLSSNVFWKMKEVNYHDKLLDLIDKKIDISTFEEVIDLVDDKYLITKFIYTLQRIYSDDVKKRWIKNISKAIDDIDSSAYEDTLLIDGASYGFYEIVKYVVEVSKCKNCQKQCCSCLSANIRNNWALIWAANGGHFKIVKYLTEKGANIHTQNDIALIWAANYGHLEVVKYLVEKDANVHAQDDCALNGQHIMVIQMLSIT